MIKYIKKYGWCFWLGASISMFTNITPFNWQFYAIIVPMVIFLNHENNG